MDDTEIIIQSISQRHTNDYNTTTNYIYICVCVCVCVLGRAKQPHVDSITSTAVTVV